MVECSFTDPDREEEWNRYYSGPKLDSVLAVPGFRTSQRFRALDDGPARYLAIHTVATPGVLIGTNYKSGGGGNFGEWQPCIADWKRNLFDGCDVAPEVGLEEYLLVSDRPRTDIPPGGPALILLATIGLDRSTPQRTLALIGRDRVPGLPPAVRRLFRIYEPMMLRRSEPSGKPATIA